MVQTLTHTEQEARQRLLEWIKEGDTVYTVLRSCSRTGMTRVIDLVIIREGQPIYPAYNAAIVLGWKYDKDGHGIKVSGCGMDMGFHLVYTLSYVLFNKNGYALQQRWI